MPAQTERFLEALFQPGRLYTQTSQQEPDPDYLRYLRNAPFITCPECEGACAATAVFGHVLFAALCPVCCGDGVVPYASRS